jgi:AAA family ATP:ADP antiporter
VITSAAHADLHGAARAAAISADRAEVIRVFYSNFFFWVNLISLFLQAFAVSRLIGKLGVRRTLFVLPLIALGAYAAVGVIGGLAVVRAAKVSENSTEYSVQNTVRQTLFLSTARAIKYKAKAAIDSFVVRAGDSLSALLVWFAIHEIGLHGRGIALVNVALVGVWLAIAVALVRRPESSV